MAVSLCHLRWVFIIIVIWNQYSCFIDNYICIPSKTYTRITRIWCSRSTVTGGMLFVLTYRNSIEKGTSTVLSHHKLFQPMDWLWSLLIISSKKCKNIVYICISYKSQVWITPKMVMKREENNVHCVLAFEIVASEICGKSSERFSANLATHNFSNIDQQQTI